MDDITILYKDVVTDNGTNKRYYYNAIYDGKLYTWGDNNMRAYRDNNKNIYEVADTSHDNPDISYNMILETKLGNNTEENMYNFVFDIKKIVKNNKYTIVLDEKGNVWVKENNNDISDDYNFTQKIAKEVKKILNKISELEVILCIEQGISLKNR